MKTYLVTAVGSFSATCVVNAIKHMGCKVVGTDIYPQQWHHIAKSCDKFYQVPLSTTSEYIPKLIDICKKNVVDAVIPLTDLEIDVLRENTLKFKAIGCKLYIESDAILDIVRNKLRLTQTFCDNSIINVPKSYSSERYLKDHDVAVTKLIAKPVNGRSSEGLYRIDKGESLRFLDKKENYIIQECIDGSVYTVDYVRDCNGNAFAVPREELLRTKNGAGITVKITKDIELIESAEYIGDKLKIVGCVNMEFISNNGKFYLIDINPRFSAGIGFTIIAGYNIVQSHINAFEDGNIIPPIDFSEQVLEKVYVEVVN